MNDEQNVTPYDLLDYIDNKSQWKELTNDSIFFIDIQESIIIKLDIN